MLRTKCFPGLVLICLFILIRTASAQNASLAPEDLAYSNKAYHLVAKVTMAMADYDYIYQYDRYSSGWERIKTTDGVFVRYKGKHWKKSNDGGKTGTIVDDGQSSILDDDASLVRSIFLRPSREIQAWKQVKHTRSTDKKWTYYTYEQDRKRPRPNDPSCPYYSDLFTSLFTFVKSAHDTDGHLLLHRATGVEHDAGPIPYEIDFRYIYSRPVASA